MVDLVGACDLDQQRHTLLARQPAERDHGAALDVDLRVALDRVGDHGACLRAGVLRQPDQRLAADGGRPAVLRQPDQRPRRRGRGVQPDGGQSRIDQPRRIGAPLRRRRRSRPATRRCDRRSRPTARPGACRRRRRRNRPRPAAARRASGPRIGPARRARRRLEPATSSGSHVTAGRRPSWRPSARGSRPRSAMARLATACISSATPRDAARVSTFALMTGDCAAAGAAAMNTAAIRRVHRAGPACPPLTSAAPTGRRAPRGRACCRAGGRSPA